MKKCICVLIPILCILFCNTFAMTGGIFNVQAISDDTESKVNPKLTIALDPGHGGDEDGADYHGKQEKDIDLRIAKTLKDKLSVYDNVTVVLTRETDENVGLKERAQRAAQAGADIFISLHCNAGVSHVSQGASVYVSTGEANRKRLCDFADYFLGEFEAIGLANAGTFARITQLGTKRADGSFEDYYGVLRHSYNCGMPAILIEHCYMDNEEDWNYIKDDKLFDKLVTADANAIAVYYDLTDRDGNKVYPKHALKYGATTKSMKLGYYEAPRLKSIRLKEYSGKSPDLASYELDVEDGSGINYIYLVYKNSSGKTMTVYLEIGEPVYTGIHELKGYVPEGLDFDRYTLSYVGLYNEAGFDAAYSYSGGRLVGFGKCDWLDTIDYNGEAALNVISQGSISSAHISELDNKIRLGILRPYSARPYFYNTGIK